MVTAMVTDVATSMITVLNTIDKSKGETFP